MNTLDAIRLINNTSKNVAIPRRLVAFATFLIHCVKARFCKMGVVVYATTDGKLYTGTVSMQTRYGTIHGMPYMVEAPPTQGADKQ